MHDTEARDLRRADAARRCRLHARRVAERRACAAAAIPAGATGVILVDLAQLRANWQALARHVAPAECGAVVKADAYGVGAERVIPALFSAGCRSFFVATLDEAAQARALASGATVYVLDGLLPGTARDMVRLGATPVLTNLEDVRTWALARQQRHARARRRRCTSTPACTASACAPRKCASSRATPTLLQRVSTSPSS